MTSILPRVTARLDRALHASLDELIPLAYTESAPPDCDLPAHVRGASAVRRVGDRLVIVQDDVNAFAIYEEAEGRVYPLILPAGPGGRRVFDDIIGNKSDKMDLEALAVLPDERLVGFGSGASAMREKLAVVSPGEPAAIRDAGPLYRALRAQPAFAGTELNIEGAVVLDDRLLLFQRGNGSNVGVREPANAVGTLDLESFTRWLDGHGRLPALIDVTPFELGAIGGIRFTFTDAAATLDGPIAIIACAEESADALTDGPVLGCRFGYLDTGTELRVTDIRESGRRSRLKLEGIESRPHEPRDFDVVADLDDPLEPGLLGRLRVSE